jgi:glycosyltransferase involved in cell wall biosynthesis
MNPFFRPDISIIIPVHNEAASIGDIVRRAGSVMDSLKCSYDINVIDDGSEDQTAEIAGAAGASVIRHPYTIGNGAAVKTGIRTPGETFLSCSTGTASTPRKTSPACWK